LWAKDSDCAAPTGNHEQVRYMPLVTEDTDRYEPRLAPRFGCGFKAVLTTCLALFMFLLEPYAATTGTVNYAYDSLGRLIAAYDPSGDAAVYSYDAVGNLLSITNYSSTTFTGIELSSSSGTAGSNITVYGTDFCSSPTVTISSVSATVVSATATQIVVTVPAGATTGSVVVTCGSNNVNLGTFTVIAANGAPSITNFSPSSGAPGTSVTISGSNFQTTTADNYVDFGVSDGSATSATTTSLVALVPSTASTGPIQVSTAYGQAMSSTDFFVPPPGASGTMSATAQLTVGSPSTITIASGGYGLFAFNGTSGQMVSVSVSTAFSCGSMNVFTPSNVLFESFSNCGNGFFAGAATLPETGTYTIQVSGGSGNVTATVYNIVNNVGSLVLGGPPVTFTDSTPGESPTLTFTGTAGQTITLNLSGGTWPSGNGNTLEILNPNGTTLTYGLFGTSYYNAGGIALGPIQLPTSGTYSAVIVPAGAGTGDGALQIFNFTDQSSAVNKSDSYATTVLADNPALYWRLDESGLATAYNAAPTIPIIFNVSGPTNPDHAITLNAPTAYLSTSTGVQNPTPYSVEVWFKTTTQLGGKLVGLEDQQTGPAIVNEDRNIYMNNGGQLVFGQYSGAGSFETSAFTTTNSYNDGNWHQAVGTYDGGSNLLLYVDGSLVASDTSAGPPLNFYGWWKIGYGDLINANWPSYPSSLYFHGSLGEVAVWNSTALTATQISSLYGSTSGGSYDSTLLGDSPSSYWKLNETSGTTFADATGNGNTAIAQSLALNGLYLGSETLGAAGIIGDDTAVTLNGSSGYINDLTPVPSPQGSPFSEEIWFKTATTQGGTLIGFNNALTGTPTAWDRTLYMTNSGTLMFGIWNGSGVTTIGSNSAYNDGNWHYAVGVLTSAQQLILYVDGSQVASSSTGINDNATWGGYWNVGYTNYASNRTSSPTSYYFAGTVDEPAIYSYALSSTQVSNHFNAR
jgi:YD repeat-containing protein